MFYFFPALGILGPFGEVSPSAGRIFYDRNAVGFPLPSPQLLTPQLPRRLSGLPGRSWVRFRKGELGGVPSWSVGASGEGRVESVGRESVGLLSKLRPPHTPRRRLRGGRECGRRWE